MQKVIDYVKSAIVEIKKVSWPTKKEITHYTILVIIISLLVAAVLGALDYVFNLAIQAILTKKV
jgi:preprotein translocase subunit SecE